RFPDQSVGVEVFTAAPAAKPHVPVCTNSADGSTPGAVDGAALRIDQQAALLVSNHIPDYECVGPHSQTERVHHRGAFELGTNPIRRGNERRLSARTYRREPILKVSR